MNIEEFGERETSWPFNIDQIEDKTKSNYFSLLPEEKELSRTFVEAFVINKPMNSVGGDGYWFYKKKDSIFLAVFDCEGQGHLASMMTRIYAKALKRLVVENAIEFPGSILQFIHREIQSKFRDRENIQLNTGADLGIVKIDLAKKEMEFAGAHMDIVQITDGNIQIIKGDELKIGEMFEHKHEYNSVSVDISKPSKFYLFSDGVSGLHGGTGMRIKSFGINNVKLVLQKYMHLNMQKQKDAIQDTLHQWSGSNVQNDDILMVGFRI